MTDPVRAALDQIRQVEQLERARRAVRRLFELEYGHAGALTMDDIRWIVRQQQLADEYASIARQLMEVL